MENKMMCILFISFVMLITYQLWCARMVRGRRKKYQHLIRVEKTREFFAVLRNRLCDLVLQKELAPTTYTFRSLYQLYSIIMRRPDKYSDISRVLFHAFITAGNKTSDSMLQQERATWTQGVKDLFRETAKGISLLIIDYSSTIRFFCKIMRMSEKTKLAFLVSVSLKAKEDIENQKAKKSKTVNNFRQAHLQFQGWATA